MTILNFVGWETGYQSTTLGGMGEGNAAGTISLSSAIKRSGIYSLRTNPTTTAVGYVVIGTHTGLGQPTSAYNEATVYARFYLYIATLPAANNEEIFVAYTTASAYKLALRINSSGKLMAFASDGTTQLGSDGATTLSTGIWYRIEVQIGTGATANYEVRIDGATELSGTGNLSTTNNGLIVVGKVTNRNGQSVDFYYDDDLISNSAWPGAGQSLVMAPDGDGTYTAWTIGAGGGADWTNIEEIPNDGATTYLQSTNVVGDTSSAALVSAATAGISGTILCVKPIVIHNRAALSASAKIRLRSGTTNSDSSAFSNGKAWLVAAGLYETDPATGLAWELSALDSIEVGMVENHTTRKTNCTAMYAMVEFIPAPPPPSGNPWYAWAQM